MPFAVVADDDAVAAVVGDGGVVDVDVVGVVG